MQKPMSHFVNPDDVTWKVSEFLFHLTLIVLSRPEYMVSVLCHFSPLKRYMVELARVELASPSIPMDQ